MAKDPAFLFYSSDFLTGTALLNYEEIGKYVKLLCYMHQHGALTKSQMENLVGNLSDNLMVKFSLTENGTYINERLFEEIEKRKKFTESRRENGKKGGRKPLGYPNGYPSGEASANLPENENENVIEVRSIDRYKDNFTNDYITDEKVCKENGFSEKQLETAKFEFWNTKELDEEMLGKSYQDVQKHFLNWCRANKKRLKQDESKSGNGKEISDYLKMAGHE